jgi:endonuclease/exonuclease/phosphatase family metal-dependent hydrolase
MQKIYHILMAICIASIVFACTEKEESPYMGMAKEQKTLGFSAEAGYKYVTVNTNRNFTATADQSWCTTEVIAGKTDNLKISVVTNNATAPRTAKIVVASPDMVDITVTVTQFGAEFTLNIMTYNVRFDTNDGDNSWVNRKDVAAQVIKDNADIVGTQEVLNNQLTDLQSRLPDYNTIGVGRNGGTSGEYNAIFYKKDRFTVIASNTFWLSETPETPGSKGWDGNNVRIATWAIFEDNATQTRFFMINTHIDHIGVTAQQEGVRLVMSKIGELKQGLPVILTGDFNMTPTNTNIKYITNASTPNHLVHTKDIAVTTSGPVGTFHSFGSVVESQRNFIDYIFVSESTAVMWHQVLPEKLNNIFLSDHSPVVARIQLQ